MKTQYLKANEQENTSALSTIPYDNFTITTNTPTTTQPNTRAPSPETSNTYTNNTNSTNCSNTNPTSDTQNQEDHNNPNTNPNTTTHNIISEDTQTENQHTTESQQSQADQIEGDTEFQYISLTQPLTNIGRSTSPSSTKIYDTLIDDIKTEEELQNHEQIETQTETDYIKPSYSQALQNNSTSPTWLYINNGDDSDTWLDKLLNNMNSNLTNFDTIVWHYDRIVKALELPEGIQEFVTYKLQT